MLKDKRTIIIAILLLLTVFAFSQLYETKEEKLGKIQSYIVARPIALSIWAKTSEESDKSFKQMTNSLWEVADTTLNLCIEYYREELDDEVSPAKDIADRIYSECIPVFVDTIIYNIQLIEEENVIPVTSCNSRYDYGEDIATYIQANPNSNDCAGVHIGNNKLEKLLTEQNEELEKLVLKSR